MHYSIAQLPSHADAMTALPQVQQEFLSLMAAHQRALLKVCWTYGWSVHDRDDLLQEITARLWAAFGAYDQSRPFITWMYRVALNVAIDHHRKQKRQGRTIAGIQDVGTATSLAPDAKVEHREEAAQLRNLLDQLSDADRALLLLFLEGHSYNNIGEVLGISASNVGTRLNRLKNSLRDSLQDSPSKGK